jgi:hypothetical protein
MGRCAPCRLPAPILRPFVSAPRLDHAEAAARFVLPFGARPSVCQNCPSQTHHLCFVNCYRSFLPRGCRQTDENDIGLRRYQLFDDLGANVALVNDHYVHRPAPRNFSQFNVEFAQPSEEQTSATESFYLSPASFYKLKAKYGGMNVSGVMPVCQSTMS